ncbi:MAG: hypothetical protein QW818_02280 [Candidatus Aenigmatarchaeota archaeon]
MKKILITFASILFLVNFVYAHMEIESVDNIMNRMISNQNVSRASDLDCNKISEHEFEELGDAVMDRMVGNKELHEQMDVMMGGEGSESLRQMHITMGKNWLGCETVFQGMMGKYMIPMMTRMMGNYYPACYTSYNALLIFSAIGWILAIVLFVVLILLFTGKVVIKKRR